MIKTAKENRQEPLIGNMIDTYLQDMHHGQTNGIPQGSVLMDFIAEMVLGYADFNTTEKLLEETDYLILRYRDDYRIFTNNPQQGERIVKFLTEVMINLGLKLNPAKTKISNQVIKDAIKPDKWHWICRKQHEKSLQKYLLIIHEHSTNFPNSGSLDKVLRSYLHKVEKTNFAGKNLMPMISIVIDIAYHSPRVYPVASAILSHLINQLKDDKKIEVVEKIQKKFAKIPNTGYLEILLQRITLPFKSKQAINFNEPICKLIQNKDEIIWNKKWISSKTLKAKLDANLIINREKIADLPSTVSSDEIKLFAYPLS